MTSLIIFLVLGASLLLLLVFALSRRRSPAAGSSEAFLDARQALSALQNDLLAADLVRRLFAKDDLDYILQFTPESVQKLFIQERRKVTLVWVRQVRKGVMSLRAFHRGQARHYARLRLETEFKLAVSFAVLLLACRALEIALYFKGPYAAPQIVGRTVGVAGRLCAISEKSLGFLTPGSLGDLTRGAAGEQAKV